MKSTKDIEAFILQLIEDTTTCYIGTVIHFIKESRTKHHLKIRRKVVPFQNVAERLIQNFCADGCVDRTKLIYSIKSVWNDYSKCAKTVDRNWFQIVDFLRQIFQFPLTTSTIVSESAVEITPPLDSEHSINVQKVTTPLKTRQDCINCTSAKKVNVTLNKKLQSHKGRLYKIKKSAADLKKEWKVRTKNQKLKRYEARIDVLKCSLRNLEIKVRYYVNRNKKLNDKVTSLENECAALRLESQKSKLEVEVLKDNLKDKEKEKSVLDKYTDELLCRFNDLEKEVCVVHSRQGKSYTPEIRQCVYYQLLSDVPVSSCGFLIKVILKILTGKVLDRVPCPSTCAQMAYELGIISTIHLMEYMLYQRSLCLSWDATSIIGAHVNEIHLTVNKVQCLVLDVRHLPGGTGADYTTHIMSALTEAAEIYARYCGKPEEEVLRSLLSSISSTLTDRAAVNAAVTRQLCSELESDLLQLNCNVHPLDSVARVVKTDLAKLDKLHSIQGLCFGPEGAAANLIKAVSVMRHKDGKGDPVGFMNFLRHHGIPLGTFVRYVGNRLHVLFHLAGILILHHAKFTEYVEQQCKAAETLRKSVLSDLKNNRIMAQVWALAVLGKIVTGPWMSKFYSSTMSNLEMGPLIRCCVRQLEAWIADPFPLMQIESNVFGDRLEPSQDEVLFSITDYEIGESALQIEAMVCVLRSTLTVIKRQLGSFVDGAFSAPSDALLEKAANAPTHNMASERALGALDRMWRRAPNATLGYLNGKVRCKLNRTMDWLADKGCDEKESIIRFVLKEGTSSRGRNCIAQRGVLDEVSRRRDAVSLQRDKTKRRAVEKSIKKCLAQSSIINPEQYSTDLSVKLSAYIELPESVIGTLVIKTAEQKYARVQAVKKNHKFVMSFWNLDESESTSIDRSVHASSFFADIVLGSVVFM